MVSQVQTDYDNSFTFTTFPGYPYPTLGGTYGLLKEKREYGYGLNSPGSLLRKTDYTYSALSNSNYLNANVLNPVAQITVYDGNGTMVSQTTNTFDGTTLQPSGVTTQHNSVANPGYRGNLTKIQKWLNTTGGQVTTQTSYYDTGMPYISTDANNNSTQYTYDPTYVGAYVTQTQYPSTGSPPVPHIIKGTYDFNTGVLNSFTDENSQTSNYHYDILRRMTNASFPDGGSAGFSYTDTFPVQIQKSVAISSSLNKVTNTIFDGLGRVSQTQLTSDPDGATYVDSSYDALGRKATVSNPHRAASLPTDGTTTYGYDALSRITSVLEPDGSQVSTSYSGACTTVTDEALKIRESCSDGLGRLTQVFEDPNGLNYETDYNYDALNNLKQVTQGSETRSFTYDSLSRLLSAVNPESGTINYSYAIGSALCSGELSVPCTKTDARGITTTYSYDALNRLSQKTYSDGTPAISYSYDQPSVSGLTLHNSIGRLTQQVTNSSTAQRIFSYDPMGRIASQWDCLPSNCGASNYGTSMLYDLAGDLTQLTYPSGRVVGYTYTKNNLSAGRVVQASLMNGSNSIYTYASGLTYWPNGNLNVSVIGNNSLTALTETYGDNKRLQIATEGIVSPVIWAMNHTYNFVDGQNNGNVPKITDQLTSARTQTFTYDSLNRLSTATETAWGLSFGYDRYGNLLQQNVTLGSAPSFSAAANTNNQLVGYGYDASGNMTSDGTNTYQYDGESRLKSLNGGSSVNYKYDADNTRIVKQVGADTAEYIIANGQNLSEHHSANWNDWSDRVYLGGRMLAKADNYEDRILLTGSTAGNQYSLFAFPSAGGYAGYVMRSGDKLFLRQYQTSGSHGGIQVAFTDGSNTNWNVNDQDGQQINNDGTSGSWHYRRFDLSSYAGKTISQIYLVQEISTTANPWSIYCTDISMVSLDGSVRPLYNRETSIALTHSGNSAGTASVNHLIGEALSPDTTTTFYHGDHLGSSRIMSSVNGYPVWQATYLPFGYEYNPQITVNHFKFTGKERDAESGLDDFGARYNASSMGRFMTPDPGAFSPKHLSDPQGLNLYAYTRDNPLKYVDPDGKDWQAVWNDLKVFAGSIYIKAGVGVGVEGGYKRGTFEAKAGFSLKANIETSSDAPIRLFQSVDVGTTAGAVGGPKTGLGISQEQTALTIHNDKSVTGQEQPSTPEVTVPFGGNTTSANASSDRIGVGVEGGLGPAAVIEAGTTSEGVVALRDAISNVKDEVILPSPATPPPPPAPKCQNPYTCQ